MKNLLQVNRALVAKKTFTNFKSDLTGMVRKWYGNGSTNSRLDSLSLVSRQSDLRIQDAKSSYDTFSVGQCSPHAFPFEAKSQLASSRQSDLDYSHRSDLRYSRATLALLSRVWKYAAMVTLLLTLACTNVWGADYTFETSTFASDKLSSTVNGQTFTFSLAHGGGGSNSYAGGQGSKYIKISANKTETITFPSGFVASNINIKGYTNKDNVATGELSEVAGVAQSGKTFPARNSGNVSEYDFAIASNATSVTIKTKKNTEQVCLLITITGTPAGSTWYVKGGWNNWETTTQLTGDGTTLTATASLSANTDYEFKIFDSSASGDAQWWGNTGKIGGNISGWVFNSPGSNCHLLTTEAGTYTFEFNTSSKALAVTYPNSYTFYYGNTSSWSHVYVYKFTTISSNTGNSAAWPGAEIASPAFSCGGTDYYAATSDGYAKLIFTNNSGNQTGDMVVSSSDAGKYVSGTGNSWSAFSTYTISFAAGSGSGSMSSIGSISCGSDQTIPANSFTAPSGYQFAGWKANVAVKVGGVTQAAGTVLADGVTIQDISSNITLTAQWEENSDPCSVPAALTNEIARFQVPCGVDRTTTYNVTNEPYGSTNTFTTANFGGSSNWYYNATTGLSYGKMTSSSGLTITIKLNTGNFQAGDVVYVYANRDQTGKQGVKVGSTNKVTIGVSSTASGVEASGSYTLLSTDIEADGSLKFYREGSNSYINRIIVTREPSCEATAPGTISKSFSACTLTLTADGSPASNNTWYWQTAADGTATNLGSGATKVVSTAGTYYIRSYYSTGSCWSEAKSITITTADLTPAAPSVLTAGSTTAKGTTFTVTDAANTNNYEFYVSKTSTAPVAGTTATYTSTSKTKAVSDLEVYTTYYAWVRSVCGSYKSGWTALTGTTFTTSKVNVTHNLTNVTKTSGDNTAGGANYTAVYAGATDYALPSTITVTIDGNTATSGTDYTWTQATGTLTIPQAKITGDIVVTITSTAAAPSSVAISGEWLRFAGEAITLNAVPTGGNGPLAYQWYKGGKANGNAISGATSATFTKNNCAFPDDAGSYYCKVTGGGSSVWAVTNGKENYDVIIPHLYVKTGRNDGVKSDYDDVDFARVDASTATASMVLGANWDYCFNIADGCGHYYGNAGTMQYNSYGPWVTNVNNQDCGLRTTNGATYIFTINYSNWTQLTTTVTFPVSNQAAGKVIYFDNNVLNWTGSSIYYRIGHATHSQHDQMTLVPGTANLYKMTTREYNNFMGWFIANAQGGSGTNKSIYNTVNTPAITKATAHEGGAVTQSAVTVTPTTSRGAGQDIGINDNCTFYNYDITSGMKTDNVAITAPSNGTITVSYTDVNNAAQSFTSGNRDLAHTVIITPMAAPSTGYDLSTLTVNGSAHPNNTTYTCSGATVVAATFSLHNYNVTYSAPGNGNNYTIKVADGSATSESKTATMGQTITIVASPATGYDFTGWTITKVGGGTVEPVNASATTTTFTMPANDVTITASFTLKTYTITYNAGSGAGISGSHANDTKTYGVALTLPGVTFTRTGYTQTGWATSDGGSQAYALSGSYTDNAAANLYPVWTAKTTTITINANTANHGSTTPGTVTATWGSALPSFTAATGASGWNLTGYWTAATGGNKIINADGTLVASTSYADGSGNWNSEGATLTLYAQYESVFTVTFNSNGGSAVSPITQASEGASITMPAAPTYADHTFQGWVIGGTTYAVSASYTPTANVTAYAVWRADCAGGTTEVYNGENVAKGNTTASGWTIYNSSSMTLTSGSSNGYSYWYQAGSSTSYVQFNGSIAVESGDQIKIKWTHTNGTSKNLALTINGSSASLTSGGSASSSTLVEAVYDVTSTTTVTSIKLNSSGSSGCIIYQVTVIKGSGSCYYVTYDGNGAESGSISDATAYASGANVTVLGNTGGNAFVKSGNTFIGWNTEADGTGTPYTAGDEFSISNNVTLYAQWSDGSTYTLTWNTNGGSALDCSGSCTSGELEAGVAIVAPNDPTLSNYTFDGWKTNNDGTGTAARATMPAANTTYYAAWKQTVTLMTGTQGEGDNQTSYVYMNGTSVSSFTAHTAPGYALQGYYTAGSGGTKVLNADGTFAGSNVTDYITSGKWSRTGAAPTLYAQWLAAEDCSTSDFVIKKGSGTEYQGCMESSSYDGTATSFTAGSPTTVGNAKMTISHYSSGAIKRPSNGNVFSIVIESVTGYYLRSICWAGKVENDEPVSFYWNNNSGSATTISPQTTSGTGVTYNAPNNTTTKFTATYTSDGDNSGGIWWRNVQVEVCAGGGVTYNVTYNDNGKTGGNVPTDATNYSYGGTVTVKGNTGSLAKTNYSFAGWSTNNDGTGSNYVADNTFSITDNTTLYAKWTQAVTLDANTANYGSAGGSATAVWNATGLTGITHATPASGYKLTGYYTAATAGTKVLNSDGSYASENVTDYVTSGKWSRTGTAPTLYAQYESSGALIWNLGVNTSASSLTTSSKSSAFTEIAVANMTNATLTGLTYTGSAKTSLTGKISTPASYDASKYVYVTFQVANGYKFTPTSIKVKVQPIDAAQYVRLELTDNAATPNSISYTTASKLSKGSISTVEMTNGSAVEFTGTVTLKIFCYGKKYDTDGFRLGTPITIDGEIEEACTMPSYTGLDYSQTEYIRDAVASSISVTGAADVTTYLWKQNTSNDRTGGSAASGTNNTATYTPPTNANGKLYYWCELTNDCGIVKTPTVAITVRTDKTDPTVAWTDPAVTVNYGGGGYILKATVNETAWDGILDASMIASPAGIHIYDVTTGTTSNKKWIQVKFDVQTSFDRTTYASNIPFTLSLPETTNYDAVNFEHNVAYSSCSGAGAGSSYNIRMRKTITKDGNYYYSANADGWISPNTNNSHNTSAAGTPVAPFDTVASSNTSNVWIKTYHANINKVRLYGNFSANNMTVTGVYKHTTYFTADSKYSVDYTVVYNGDDSNEDLGTNGEAKYVDITLNTALDANDILLVTFSASRARPMGAVLTESSGGSLATTLVFATAGPINKAQGDASFVNAASLTEANSNSLGTITYSSSNTSVATVNATTGEVTILGAGSSTIKATLAASGCYKKAEATYTLNVTEVACEDVAGIITTEDLGCDGIRLTLSGYTEGATIAWYKDGSAISPAQTGTTYTATSAGRYYAVTHKNCDKASNTIVIADKSVSATKIVDEWYVKNGRLTPDVALIQTEGADGFTVTSGGSPITSIGGCSFYLGDDGIIYLKGAQDDGSAPSGMTAGDITITITAKVCNKNATPLSITIHQQEATDKHVLAFVVRGKEKGDFQESISSDETTNVALYNEIATSFDVLATNIYATDNEQKIKEYYSRFDIICITDYPDTKKKGVNGKSYVDAIGALIDIRPILTMEAWVSGLDNWRANGISGNPESPTTRQYTMDLQCKDHEIFSGTDMVKVGEGDETMYRVTMVDKTKEDYATLDATYGGGTHEKDKNYQYGKKPALQGFTFDAAMVADGLLPLGRIDDGAGNDLEVGIERQAEMSARLMVLGVNSYAMERLTDDGLTVIINALKYLMKKSEEDIADCSISFVGGDDTKPNDWNTASNWSTGVLPDKTTREIRILAPVIITSDQNIHAQAQIKIASDGKYNGGSDNATGSITINAGGALRVDGKIQAVTAPAFSKARPTSLGDIHIKSTSSEGNGTLIFDNKDGNTQAIVEMYCKSQNSTGNWTWQYVAVPYNDNSSAYRNYYGSWLYRWAADNSGWEVVPDRAVVYPWIGYCLTQETAKHYVMDGTLVETTEQEFTVQNGKDMVIGNSWTAPIQVKQFTDDDFGGLTKNIYLFNTGLDDDCNGSMSGGRYEAGTYVVVPIHSSSYTGDSLISSLQAFTITNASGSDATLMLNYDRHVRPARTADKVNAGPMHAPRRYANRQTEPVVLKVWVSGSNYDDRLVLLEGEDFSTGYDAGWDGEKIFIGGNSPEIYSEMESGKESVTATDEFEGTIIGFRAGEDNEYTISFTYNDEEEELYLLDIDTYIYTRVNEENKYTFTTSDNAQHSRFVLTRRAPSIATGVNDTSDGNVRARKFIYNNKMYILLNGMLYDATGKAVK